MSSPERYGLPAQSSTYSFRMGGFWLNNSHKTAFAPSDADTRSSCVQRLVGVGRLGDCVQESRRDTGQKVPAPPRRQERNRLSCQLREVSEGLDRIAKRIAAENGVDGGLIGIGIENQIGLGVAGSNWIGIGKCLVKQVVQDGSIERGLVVQILEKLVKRIDEEVARVE